MKTLSRKIFYRIEDILVLGLIYKVVTPELSKKTNEILSEKVIEVIRHLKINFTHTEKRVLSQQKLKYFQSIFIYTKDILVDMAKPDSL